MEDHAEGLFWPHEQTETHLFVSICVYCTIKAASPCPLILAMWEQIHPQYCSKLQTRPATQRL